MVNDYLITLDIDWAPDSAISKTINYLIDNQVKATWFITHASPEVERIKEYPHLFELGVHPNFRNVKMESREINSIMLPLKKIVPDAKSIRTHSLVQSTPLIKALREDHNFLYDVSLFLPLTPYITPHHLFLSEGHSICRIPYFWEDDIEMLNPKGTFNFSKDNFIADGLKIFNFHPIHIALNSCSMENYYSMNSELKNTSRQKLNLKKFKNTSHNGSETFFRGLINFIRSSDGKHGCKISEVAEKWSRNNNI